MLPRPLLRSAALLACALAVWCSGAPAPRDDRATQHVVLVTFDGLRWQEVFGGAEAALLSRELGGVAGATARALRESLVRDTPETRRAELMPFFWGTIAREGQVFGDADAGCAARITNGMRFSYPGYQELLAGFPDPRIDSNDKRENPNVTVLEWLNGRAPWRGHIAAFGSWELFPFILAEARSGIAVNAGWDDAAVAGDTERARIVRELERDLPHYWQNERYDALTCQGALAHLHAQRPRVLYVALGETDSWAHARRYDLYLAAARHADRFLRELWETLQSLPEYAGRTTLVVTTDHGRGEGTQWTSHGKDVPGCDRIWIAVLGPDTPARGVREDGAVTQAQVAATVAALLGEDWCAAEPRAARPLAGVLRETAATRPR